MKIALTSALLILATLLSCEKVDPVKSQYGCVYGVSKLGGGEVYIRCIHNELYAAGSNQRSADKLADDIGIPRIDVSYFNDYTKLRFVQNPKCDC